MLKRVCLGVMLVVLVAGLGWAATLDDVAKGVQQLQIGQARLEAKTDGIEKRVDDFGNWFMIIGSMQAILAALVVGIFGFVVYIARNIKPAEEKEKRNLQIIDSIFERLHAIEEKIHLPPLPKPILVFLITFSLLISASLAAIPEKINIQGVL